MLVLTRAKGETLCIGDIKATVADVRGDKVYIAIEAPKEVPVHHLEVWQAIQEQNKKGDA